MFVSISKVLLDFLLYSKTVMIPEKKSRGANNHHLVGLIFDI
jgi:hypothetical protein